MNNEKLFTYAEQYLKDKNIDFVKPGHIGLQEHEWIEIIFLVPQALNPNVVIDPPDVRVWVNINSGKVRSIEQM